MVCDITLLSLPVTIIVRVETLISTFFINMAVEQYRSPRNRRHRSEPNSILIVNETRAWPRLPVSFSSLASQQMLKTNSVLTSESRYAIANVIQRAHKTHFSDTTRRAKFTPLCSKTR